MLSDSIIRLRALDASDALCLYEWENISDFWLSASTLAPYSRRNIMHYIENYRAEPFAEGQLRLMIETLADAAPSGLVDLYNIEVRHRRACVGILIAPSKQHQGLAHRALALLEFYCRSHLRLHQLMAVVPVSNVASLALFDKAGYERVATLPDYVGGSRSEEYVDAILVRKIL